MEIAKRFYRSLAEKIYQFGERFYIERLSRLKRPMTFVQIGAHDGMSKDPLHTYLKTGHFQGILVKPVPELFQQLKENKSAI